MNTREQHGPSFRSTNDRRARLGLAAVLTTAALGTGVLVAATAAGSDQLRHQDGPSRDAPAEVGPVGSCFGSVKEMREWLQHGVGDPQQCIIARAPKATASQ